MGQTVHQTREKKGTITLIKRNHQKIQTKTVMIFRFPMGVPQIPVAKKTRNRNKFGRITAGWNQRFFTSHFKGENTLKRSIRQPSLAAVVSIAPGPCRLAGSDGGAGTVFEMGFMASLLPYQQLCATGGPGQNKTAQ